MPTRIASDTLSRDEVMKMIRDENISESVIKQKRLVGKSEAGKSDSKDVNGLSGVVKKGNTKRGSIRNHNNSRFIIRINGVDFEKSITRNGVKSYICAGCNNDIAVGEDSVVLLQVGDEYDRFEHRHTHMNDKCERLAGLNMVR